MVEHIERIWSSNIGDWESYWVDCDFFREHYGNLEEDPESVEFRTLPIAIVMINTLNLLVPCAC